MRPNLTEREREQAIWAIQNEMADERSTLPHEEALAAIVSLDSYLGDKDRRTNRPKMQMFLNHVIGRTIDAAD